jgi:hypothetical protein
MVRTLNLLLYQIGWFACVLGGAFSRPWLGILVALVLVVIHLSLTTEPVNQVKLMLMAVCVGLLVDTCLLHLRVYSFPSGMIVAWLPPLWMTALWLQFATTFRYCFSWLSQRYWLCACLGLFGAPLAFLGGEKLGAVSFLPPRPVNLLILGALWSLAIPLLIFLSDRLHRTVKSEASYRGLQRKLPAGGGPADSGAG